MQLLTRKLRTLDPETQWNEITLVLMDDPGIADLHERFLGDRRATDVISFRYAPTPGSGACSGEVVVNAQRARSAASSIDARGRTWSVADELALYMAHGCDHLSGADDGTPLERRRMRNRELRWLREAREKGLIAPILGS